LIEVVAVVDGDSGVSSGVDVLLKARSTGVLGAGVLECWSAGVLIRSVFCLMAETGRSFQKMRGSGIRRERQSGVFIGRSGIRKPMAKGTAKERVSMRKGEDILPR
jgi:hypothetical protein